jgi:two-component system chemotaxis response regulator CheY
VKAFLVDDSLTVRLLLGHILRELGFELEEADSGTAAITRLSEGLVPDLILLDWNMPDVSGLEVLQMIRHEPKLAGSRVMMVTSETESNMMAWALEAGADEYVMKPFNRGMIREKLALLGLLPPE